MDSLENGKFEVSRRARVTGQTGGAAVRVGAAAERASLFAAGGHELVCGPAKFEMSP